jgi:N-acetylglutamate synthase-like GNAT family acetyltransferase
MNGYQIHSITSKDRPWIAQVLTEHWGSAQVVSRGRVHEADQLPGFIAVQENQPAGLVTYHLDGDQCEITSLDSLVESIGIGTALIGAVESVARCAGCRRLWVITTNDNIHAIRFYQKRGFHLVAVHPNAIQRSRELKPSIPLIGSHGIPIRDEVEFEILYK